MFIHILWFDSALFYSIYYGFNEFLDYYYLRCGVII